MTETEFMLAVLFAFYCPLLPQLLGRDPRVMSILSLIKSLMPALMIDVNKYAVFLYSCRMMRINKSFVRLIAVIMS